MFNKKQDERFKRVYADVHYLVWKSGYAGGITPLLDAEGNVVITKSDYQ